MTAALMCRGVAKTFGGTTALAGVDLDVEPGEIRGLVGKNGAGKSTLLKCFLGLIAPDRGEISLLGRSGEPAAGAALDDVAGLVDGARWPSRMRVESALRMLADYDRIDRRRVDEVLEELSITAQRSKRIGALSLGGRQRLGVAAALLRSPKLLLLDEPINGLDPAGRRDLRALLKAQAAAGTAVLVASHDLTEIQATCDSVSRLDAGQCAETTATMALGDERHEVRLHSVDNRAAVEALADVGGVSITVTDRELRLAGDSLSLREASIALGLAGVAILRWEPVDEIATQLLDPG